MRFSGIFCGLASMLALAGCGGGSVDSVELRDIDYKGDIDHITVTISHAAERFGEIEPDEIIEVQKINFVDKLPVEHKSYDKDGNLWKVTKLRYNSKDQVVSVVEYDSDGEETHRVNYEYDGKFLSKMDLKNEYVNMRQEYANNGKYITESRIYYDDNLNAVNKNKLAGGSLKSTGYDVDGNETGSMEYNRKSLPVKIADIQGQIHLIEYMDDIYPVRYENFELHPELFYESMAFTFAHGVAGETFTVDYEFDGHGNWVKKTISAENGAVAKPKYVVERKIDYK